MARFIPRPRHELLRPKQPLPAVTELRKFLSFVFLGGARRLELSPCNTCLCTVPENLSIIGL